MAYDVNSWSRLAAKLRQALGFVSPTSEEADAEMANAEEVPMSEQEIERIVDAVTRGGRSHSMRDMCLNAVKERSAWISGTARTDIVGGGVTALFRVQDLMLGFKAAVITDLACLWESREDE